MKLRTKAKNHVLRRDSGFSTQYRGPYSISRMQLPPRHHDWTTVCLTSMFGSEVFGRLHLNAQTTNGFKSGWLNNGQNLNSWNHTQTINIESGPTTKPGKIEAGKTILFFMDYIIKLYWDSRGFPVSFLPEKKSNPSWCSHWWSSHHTPSIHWRFALRTLGFSIGPLHPSLGLIVVLVPPNMIHSCIPGPSINRSTTFNHGWTWLCNIRSMGFILNPKKKLRCHQTCNFYIHYSIFEAINRHL